MNVNRNTSLNVHQGLKRNLRNHHEDKTQVELLQAGQKVEHVMVNIPYSLNTATTKIASPW